MKSKIFAKILACLFIMLISLSAVVAAVAPSTQAPTLPAQFHGTLYNHEGKPFPAGTVITAEVNGVVSTFTLTEDGKIGGAGTFDDKFLISGVENGDTITFRVNGTDVTKTIVYDEHSAGNSGKLSLVIDAAIPTPSSDGNGGGGFVPSSSPSTGTSVIQSVTPTVTATTTVTESVAQPTATALPTEAARTPVGLAGMMLGGLAVAAIALRRR